MRQDEGEADHVGISLDDEMRVEIAEGLIDGIGKEDVSVQRCRGGVEGA